MRSSVLYHDAPDRTGPNERVENQRWEIQGHGDGLLTCQLTSRETFEIMTGTPGRRPLGTAGFRLRAMSGPKTLTLSAGREEALCEAYSPWQTEPRLGGHRTHGRRGEGHFLHPVHRVQRGAEFRTGQYILPWYQTR
jgi:hypothetical protein